MKKIISLAIAVFMLFALVGCNKYNATFYDNTHLDMKEEFLQAYPVNLYGEKELPKERYFVIETQEQLDEAFDSFYTKVDFQTEMVIIYMLRDINAGQKCELSKIELKDGKLLIRYTRYRKIGPYGSAPTQRCFAVKMNKVEFDSIEFEAKIKKVLN